MSSEAEQKFAQFDFSSDLGWQESLNNLFPTPAMDKILKIKRKWFKKNIDQSLDVDAGLPSENTTTSSSYDPNTSSQSANTSNTNQNQSSSNSQGSAPAGVPGGFLGKIFNVVSAPITKIVNLVYNAALPMKDKFFFLEGILKIAFIISALVMPGFANMIAFNVCLLGFFRQTGKPRWDINYGRKSLENEFLQNILYMVPFAFFPNSKTLVYFLPLGIHFWIGFCEFVNLRLPTIYPKIAKFADFTRQNRGQLMYQKARLEIILFVFIIAMLFFGGSNLILVIFYGNYLKTKYLINQTTKYAFSEINNWIEVKINSPYCPGILKLVVNKVRSFCGYLVKV